VLQSTGQHRCWGIEGVNQVKKFSRDQEAFLSNHRQQLRC
jgi:hypothetical protein